jgi:putative CocE/NonD family hydrolase
VIPSTSSAVVVERDVETPLRDGTILRGDLYRGAAAPPSTVLLQRTPYDKRATQNLGAMVFRLYDAIDAGYAVFVQDVRGRHRSDGQWVPFVNEANDGYDTVEWVAAQPWCDGTVAVSGASYMGVTALQAALAAPPHLRTVLTYLTGTNYFDGFVYTSGVFELAEKAKWVGSLARDTLARLVLASGERAQLTAGLAELSSHPMDLLRRFPSRDALPGHDRIAPYWADWLDHPHYDDYWRDVDCNLRVHELAVPILHIAGWYDAFLKGHLDLQRALHTEGPEHLRPHHRFMIGPWDHEAYVSMRLSHAGSRNFGAAATGGAAGVSAIALDWFARWTGGSDALPAVIADEPVRYFLMGPDTWVGSPSWPPPATTSLRVFLHSGGHANSRAGDGVLSVEPPGDEPPDAYMYDPRDPVPTTGGRHAAYGLGPAGVQDQAAVEDRLDVLVYTTALLEQPVTVTGNVRAVLWVSSDAPDTDFTAKLVDVDAAQRAWNVAEGIVRCRNRDGAPPGGERWLEPGAVVEVTIDLFDVAYEFARGNRIRVEVSSSNFPRFDRNPNAKVPVCDATESDVRVAHQRIFHCDAHPSCLLLETSPVRTGPTDG